MRSSRARLRLVTPKITLTERSTIFWLLLALPVIAGCVLAVVQSDAMTHLTGLSGGLLGDLTAQAADGWNRLKRL